MTLHTIPPPSLNFNDLIETNTILNTARVQTTWYGSRLVSLPENRGTISLNTIVQGVLQNAQLRYQNDDLTLDDRLIGLAILGKMRQFYQETDLQLSRCNCITRLLVRLRGRFSENRRLRGACLTITTFEEARRPQSAYISTLFLSFSTQTYNELFPPNDVLASGGRVVLGTADNKMILQESEPVLERLRNPPLPIIDTLPA